MSIQTDYAIEYHPIDGRMEGFRSCVPACIADGLAPEIGGRLLSRCVEQGISELIVVILEDGGRIPGEQLINVMRTMDSGVNIVEDAMRIKTRDGVAILKEPIVMSAPRQIQSGSVAVLFDDLLDTGLSVEISLEELRRHNPAQLWFASPFNKIGVEKRSLSIPQSDMYIGMDVPNGFLLGRGLDYKGYGREIRDLLIAGNM